MTTNIGHLEAHIGMNTRGLRRDVTRANGMFSRFGRGAGRSVQGITRSVGGMAAALGGVVAVGGGAAAFIGFLKSAATVGAQFEQTMVTVAGVMRATVQEQDALTESARRMGETTEFTASQAGGALRFLGMAGFDATKAIAALPGTLDLATAGNIDLGRAADIATNALTAMGLGVEELGRVNDVLVGTATRTNTDINEMAEAFQYAAPFARAYGYSVEELAGMIGTMANSGVKASMAGTSLRRALVEANKIAKKFSLTSSDLVDVVEQLGKKGYTAQQIMTLFKDRAGLAAGVIANAAAETRELQKTLGNTAGEAKVLADAMRGTLVGRFKELQSVMEGVKLDIFDRMKARLLDYVRSATRWIREHKDEIVDAANRVVRAIDGIGKVIGVIVAIVGRALGVVGSFISGMQDAWGASEAAATRAADTFTTSADQIAKDAMRAAAQLHEVELALLKTAMTPMPAFTTWDKFVQKVQNGVNSILAVLKWLARSVGTILVAVVRSVVTFAENAFAAVVQFGENIAKHLALVAESVAAAWSGQFAKAKTLMDEALAVPFTANINVDGMANQMAIVEEMAASLSAEWDALTAKLAETNRDPEAILTEEWGKEQEQRLKRLGARAEALRVAIGKIGASGRSVGNEKPPPGGGGDADDAAAKAAKALQRELQINGQVVSSYGDLLNAGRHTKEQLERYWSDYHKARKRQIELQARAFMAAGASAMEVVLFVKAETAKLNEDMQAQFDHTGNWLKAWAKSLSEDMAAAFSDGFFRAMKGELEHFRDFFNAFVDVILADIARKAGTQLNDVIQKGLDLGVDFLSRGGGHKMGSQIGESGQTSTRLAEGGIVMRPKLAMIGEAGPEAVVPLNRLNDPAFMKKLQGAGAGGGGTVVNMTVQTQDATSFMRSRQQIMAELGLTVARAQRNF